MKALAAAAILLALASCARQIPRAVIVETARLEETTENVAKSSAKLGEGIGRVEDSHDRATSKADELLREIEAVRKALGVTPDLRAAFDRQVRLGAELAREHALGKAEIRTLKKLKEGSDRDILTLQLVVGDLVIQAGKANQVSKELEKIADQNPALKEKLKWWRWRYLPASIVLGTALLAWIFRKPLLRLIRPI